MKFITAHRVRHSQPKLPQLVALGSAATLTLGEGGTGSEDKRYAYNATPAV